MHSTHLLTSVSQPPQRLFIAQNALPLSLGAGFLLFQLMLDFWALMGWGVIHGLLAYCTYKDPYFISVWRAKFKTGRTERRHLSGGNCYDL